MSLKDRFKKNSNKILPSTSLEDIGVEIESAEYEEELKNDKKRFIPDVNFSLISNFAKFGSAEKYYYDAITSIYGTYPYDGSLYEKLKWHNNSSDIRNYVFENLYPRTNGYINLGQNYGNIVDTSSSYSLTDNLEYIFVKGGPNSSDENKLKDKFYKANKLDYENNRTYNLYINGNVGFTTEFWFKKNLNTAESEKQVIFDLWNSGTVSSTPNSPYGRFILEFSTSSLNEFNVIVRSGSEGTPETGIPIGVNLNLTASSWNHYALSVINSGSQLKIDLYKNGELNSSTLTGSSILEITGAYIATIGSLITKHQTLANTNIGYGKLSASLDEFRFWKLRRSDKKIKQYWYDQVGGGTNTDDANTDLGVYFKFNEGIYNSSSISEIDKKVIDYSGRVSNGYWTGYVLGSRNTGSAIVESLVSNYEFKDPILYSTHPEVLSVLQERTEAGREYDSNNNSSLINSFPKWMIDQDYSGLSNLSQLISEYFDDLYLKIKYLPEIHNSSYSRGKPITFAARLLESHGFTTSELFTEATVLESLISRNETQNFEEKIFNIKNFIYQNIFNNLTYIYRSKGTEKSIRNLIRCFGVDENLIKINLYADNTTFTIKDRYVPVSVKKKYVDFSNVNQFESTVYQHRTIENIDSLSYIPGDMRSGYNGTTLQVEVFAPYKYELSENSYYNTPFVTSSIIGMHSANSSLQDDYTWFSVDSANLEVYLIKESINSKNGKFKLTSSFLGIDLETPLIKDIYNDEKWNLSITFYHEKYPNANKVTGSDVGNYILEFKGNNVVSDVIINSFNLSSSVSNTLAEQHFSSAKRIYVGAHRQNFTGSVLQRSDARISSVRYWLNKLSDNTLLEHAKDPNNYGIDNPSEQFVISLQDTNFIPSFKTLALNWDFENVTSSDSNQKFIVEDLTSGSINAASNSWLTDITKYQFLGRGDFFQTSNTDTVKREFVNALKRKQPESLNDADMVNILQEDDIAFTRDSEPVVHYFTLEKSMYQIISDEIIKFFGSIVSLNNLIGEPSNRYRQSYKYLNNLKEHFFNNVQNDIDLERFIEFYKWFDQAIGDMAEQLIPISANFSTSLKTVIESHILERNKYWNKYPTLEIKKEPPIAGAHGIVQLKYNWRVGHAPISLRESDNCLWWNLRAHASGNLNPDRKLIIDSKENTLNRKFTTVYDFVAEASIQNIPGHPSRIIDDTVISITNINTGRTDFIKPQINFSNNSYLSISANDLYDDKDCNDE
jgi:hypothetical protein